MTDIEAALVVAGVSLFGAFWLKVERRQACEKAQREQELKERAPLGQKAFSFPTETHELASMGRDR
jgi:hypothetical protein